MKSLLVVDTLMLHTSIKRCSNTAFWHCCRKGPQKEGWCDNTVSDGYHNTHVGVDFQLRGGHLLHCSTCPPLTSMYMYLTCGPTVPPKSSEQSPQCGKHKKQ